MFKFKGRYYVNLSIYQCNRSCPFTVKKAGPVTNWVP